MQSRTTIGVGSTLLHIRRSCLRLWQVHTRYSPGKDVDFTRDARTKLTAWHVHYVEHRMIRGVARKAGGHCEQQPENALLSSQLEYNYSWRLFRPLVHHQDGQYQYTAYPRN
jgi:hypothetical protein